MRFFFSAKKIIFFWKIKKSSDFSHSSASARKAKEGISPFWTDFGDFDDFRHVAHFSRKSSARTAGSGPPPIQLSIKTFYLCILMDICKSKTRFTTSQALWEALARATSCDFGQKPPSGALRAPGEAKIATWQMFLENQVLGRQGPARHPSY